MTCCVVCVEKSDCVFRITQAAVSPQTDSVCVPGKEERFVSKYVVMVLV